MAGLNVANYMDSNPVCIMPETTLFEARRLVRRHPADFFPVIDEDTRIIGMLPACNIKPCHIFKVKPHIVENEALPPSLYNHALYLATGDTDLLLIADMMLAHRVNAIGIVDSVQNRMLEGILTQYDAIRAIAGQLKMQQKYGVELEAVAAAGTKVFDYKTATSTTILPSDAEDLTASSTMIH